MKSMKLTTVLLTAMAALALRAGTASARDLTIVNWGGPPAALQKEIYQDPFTKHTGFRVLVDNWSGGYGVLKAKVESGQIDWDIVQVEADEEALGWADGIYEKLDWSMIGNREGFFPGLATDCGVGSNYYAFVLAYDADKIANGPSGWAGYWDTQKFPGKRAMRKGAKGTLEIALLADGVPPNEVYAVLRTKEGVDRAFSKLDAIKPDLVWWESTSQIMQLISSGEVVMAEAYDAAINRLIIQEKKNLKIVWNQTLSTGDSWVIMKGTPFLKEALQLVAFMSKPENLARYGQSVPVGVPSAKAMELVPAAVSDKMLSAPEHVKLSLPIDAEFWIDNGEELTRRFNTWLAR